MVVRVFVAQSHMVRHGTARAYVLIGTVAGPGALARVEDRLATFEPEALRHQVAASWALEATVDTPEPARQLMRDQMPFHVADPSGPLVAELVEADRVVYRPEVLRHFAAGGEYGMLDLREELRSSLAADADPQRRARSHDGGRLGARVTAILPHAKRSCSTRARAHARPTSKPAAVHRPRPRRIPRSATDARPGEGLDGPIPASLT